MIIKEKHVYDLSYSLERNTDVSLDEIVSVLKI